MNKSKKVILFLFTVFTFFTILLISPKVQADVFPYSCVKHPTTNRCYWRQDAPCISPKYTSCLHCGDWGYDYNYECGKIEPVGNGVPGCSNVACACESSCSCTPRSCPTPLPANKFRQRPIGNGSSTDCADKCNPVTATCDASYYNTPPTCSIAPATISTTRTSDPVPFVLTVNDSDYGDTVTVRDVRVVDTHGNLKSCVNVATQNGGSIDNLTVKVGSSTSTDVSQNNILQVDARNAYGVYDFIGNGLSQCSGILEIEIADSDSDGNGPDVSDFTTCSVNISVTNDNPTISNISIQDRDQNATLRRDGNLATSYVGNNSLPVGSLHDARRVSLCSSAIDTTGVLGNCANWIPQKTRTNPYELSFHISDNEGYGDIKDIGFWIQRADTAASLEVPLFSGNLRQSIQGLVGQRKNYRVPDRTGDNYFTAAPCIGNICKRDILTENLLSYVYSGANITYKTSTSNNWNVDYKEWLKKGFPNCLFIASGCNGTNVPDLAKNTITTDRSKFYNYDWMVAADRAHMMCLSSTSNTSSVIPASETCPSTCAACVALENLEAVNGNDNAIDVKFLIYMNDKYTQGGSGPGMAEGRYEIFVGATDSVGGLAYGNNFWRSLGATSNRFSLMFDAQPPSIIEFGISQNGESINAFGILQDTETQKSSVAGLGTRYVIKEEYESGTELTGDISFLSKIAGSTTDLWNGANDFVDNITLDTQGRYNFAYTGHGIDTSANYLVSAGLCAYDEAGNMCCSQTIAQKDDTSTITKSCSNYDTLGIYRTNAPWVQAAVGSVYSNSDGAAFSMTVPNSSSASIANSQTGAVSGSYAPYTIQSGSAVSGLLVSGGEEAGLVGGREFGNNQYALGFSKNSSALDNYRTTNSSANGNAFSIATPESRSWYEILHSSTLLNCELSGNCTVPETSLLSLETTTGQSYIVISDSTDIDTPLVCKGANVIFITKNASVSLVEVYKANKNSGCIFVVDEGASLTIVDVDFKAQEDASIPGVDRFEAAVVVANGGKFEVQNAASLRTVVFDRLQINGFLYSDPLPLLSRTLRNEDNEHYPAEWFIYDANLLDVFRNMLGTNKTVDLVCGTSNNIFCVAQ